MTTFMTYKEECESLRRELENERARDIHSCGPDCTRSGCVNRRLLDELAEKDAEIERLSRLNSSYSNLTKAQEGQLTALRNRLYELKGADKTLDSERDANAILTEQLAVSQAREQELRGAFQTYIDEHEECTDADDWMAMTCSMEAHHVADEALAQPADTTALQAMIAKAGEVMRERCAKACTDRSAETDADDFDEWDQSNYSCAEAIHALPGVTLEDLK